MLKVHAIIQKLTTVAISSIATALITTAVHQLLQWQSTSMFLMELTVRLVCFELFKLNFRICVEYAKLDLAFPLAAHVASYVPKDGLVC